MDENRKPSASTRTKVLIGLYLMSGLSAVGMTVAFVCLAALAVLGRGPNFKIDGWPYVLAVLIMFAAKIATRWSLRRDEKNADH